MKRISRIGLLMMIVMGMIFATAAVSFADENHEAKSMVNGVTKGTKAFEAPKVSDRAKMDIAKRIIDKDDSEMTMSAKSMTIYRVGSFGTITSGYPTELSSYYEPSENKYVAVSEGGYAYRGMMYFYGYATQNNVEYYIVDENGTPLNDGFVLEKAYRDYIYPIYIPKSGTYYVVAFSGSAFETAFKLSNAPVYDYKALFLVNNRNYYSGHATKACTITYKFKAVATGAMRVETDLPAKISISDTAGRTIGTTLNGLYDPTFGVQKGKIYMIRVAWPNTAKTTFNGITRLRVINATWTSAAGKTKGTAATLKRGVYRKGLIIAGQNNIGWFKFKPQKKTFKIYVEGGTNDRFVYRVYCNNKYVSSTVYSQPNALRWNEFTGPKNATWYVKVERVNSTSSGRYQIKFL